MDGKRGTRSDVIEGGIRREGRRDGRRTWTRGARGKRRSREGSARFASRTRDGRAGSSAQGRSASTAAAAERAPRRALDRRRVARCAPRGRGAAAHRRRREDAAARGGDSAVEHVGERASLGDDDAGARVAREWQPPRRRARFQTSRGPNFRTGGSRRKVSSLEYVTLILVCVSVMSPVRFIREHLALGEHASAAAAAGG